MKVSASCLQHYALGQQMALEQTVGWVSACTWGMMSCQYLGQNEQAAVLQCSSYLWGDSLRVHVANADWRFSRDCEPPLLANVGRYMRVKTVATLRSMHEEDSKRMKPDTDRYRSDAWRFCLHAQGGLRAARAGQCGQVYAGEDRSHIAGGARRGEPAHGYEHGRLQS